MTWLEFITSMETVWVALITVLGMLLTHVLTNRHNEKRLKSEEDRWYSQKFLEHKVEVLANLSGEITRLARTFQEAPGRDANESCPDLNSGSKRFVTVLLGASAYLKGDDADEIVKCAEVAEALRKKIRDAATTDDAVLTFVKEGGKAFGKALRIANEYIPDSVKRKK